MIRVFLILKNTILFLPQGLQTKKQSLRLKETQADDTLITQPVILLHCCWGKMFNKQHLVRHSRGKLSISAYQDPVTQNKPAPQHETGERAMD